MSPTLTEDVSIDDVLTMLSYINFENPISRPWIKDGLEILLAENGQWDLNDLADQVQARTDVLAGRKGSLTAIRDVAFMLNHPDYSYEKRLVRARKIKNLLTNVLDLEPEINMSDIPF